MSHSSVDLSKYKSVFCDSIEALSWAYDNGLSKDTLIKSSSPALLMKNYSNVQHVESKWSGSEINRFQTTIKIFTEDIYDSLIAINGVSHELAICTAIAAGKYHRFLFKASCLTKNDLVESRLFISVEGDGGPNGNNMNPPWEQLLESNQKFTTIKYKIKSNDWSILSSAGVPWLERIRIGGFETIVFRLLDSKIGKLYSNLFKRQVLIPEENELVIETAFSLVKNGIGMHKIKPRTSSSTTNSFDKFNDIYLAIDNIIENRVKEWVIPDLVETCKKIFIKSLHDEIKKFVNFRSTWLEVIKKAKSKKSILLSNNISNAKTLSLAELCRKKNIPIILAQHGVTSEFSALHAQVSSSYGINMCDCLLTYNYEAKKVENNSHFRRGVVDVVGISERHLRMKNKRPNFLVKTPIIYVSTSILKGNIGHLVAHSTDLEIEKKEMSIVEKILSIVPHNICYKGYPEDNRRYPDKSPVLSSVMNASNIYLFEGKKDMRYFIGNYRISITSRATSTLGWLVMSGNPVIFINFEDNAPLTAEAEKYFSEGLFLFNYNDKDFFKKILSFLSQPISDIEYQYLQKKSARKIMIERYFTSYLNDAGNRATKIIMQRYLL
jgi:hypothetical protein